MSTARAARSDAAWVLIPTHRLAGALARCDRTGLPWVRVAHLGPNAIVEFRHPPDSILSSVCCGVPVRSIEAAHYQWVERATGFRLPGQLVRAAEPPPDLATVPVPLRLKRTPDPTGSETVWVLEADAERTAAVLAQMDERVLRRFEVARVRSGSHERFVFRSRLPSRSPLLPEPFLGFIRHPQIAGLCLPANARIAPAIPGERLATALRCSTGALLLLEHAPTEPVRSVVPVPAFRPCETLIGYATPGGVRLKDAWSTAPPFEFAPFRLLAESTSPPEPGTPAASHSEPPATTAGWIKSLIGRFRVRRKTPPPDAAPKRPAAFRPGNLRSVRPTRPEADERLRSLHTATRRERVELWAAAAPLATADHPADGALYWLNAIWESETPPAAWFDAWVRAEGVAAGENASRPCSSPRLAAARLAASRSDAHHMPSDTVVRWKEQVDAHEPDLAVKAVWLANLAAARAAAGDPLGLARCRDRLTARLSTTGLAVDIDTPAFLRSHGSGHGDLVSTTHLWLSTFREPVHQFIRKPNAGGGGAGLSRSVVPTAAFADLMVAWGFGRLGDRAAADGLIRDAESALAEASDGPSRDRVYKVIHARFVDRIRAATGGCADRPIGPGKSVPTPARLDPWGHYTVDAVTARLQILAPLAVRPERRGFDLWPILGSDSLGIRLRRVLRNGSSAGLAELLSDAAADPTARTLPRVVLTAATLGRRADHAAAADIVRLLPRAISLLPESVRLAGVHGDGVPNLLVRLSEYAITSGSVLARRHHLTAAFSDFLAGLTDAVSQGDGVIRAAVFRQLAGVANVARSVGLSPDPRLILDSGHAHTPLGCWLTGRTAEGVMLLDGMREALFRPARGGRGRMRAAGEYIASLSHAPPELARERLTELFQRLDPAPPVRSTAHRIAVHTLELIDAAVTAVVSDRFDLTPAARSWMEHDEYLIRKRIARDMTAVFEPPGPGHTGPGETGG